MPPALSPEFRLVCAASRWPRGAGRDAAVREAAAVPGLDWQRVTQITRRQRVWGLVGDALRAAEIELPADVAEAFTEQTGAIARRNLGAVAATARIGRMLDEAGVDWISFKGLPLAMQAYGTLAVKMSTDIDILVPFEATTEACAILTRLGYVRFNPGSEIADHQLAAWMRVSKESGWQHPETRLVVEIHGRIMANPALLPQANIAADRQRVELAPSVSVRTLGDGLLFPYLVAHGAHHGWFRLKWLADIAALLGHDPGGIEARSRGAQALGVGRCAAQALLLAHDLLALPLPPALEREMRADRVHRRLVRIALRVMAGDYEAEEHTNAAARTMLPVTLGNLLLRRGIGYKWGELTSLAANPLDRATRPLPRGLDFLYPVLGGVRWGARMVGLIGERRHGGAR
jgi:hypothetical protein